MTLRVPRRLRSSQVVALAALVAAIAAAAGCGSTQRYPLLMPGEAAADFYTHLEVVAIGRRFPVVRGGDSLEIRLPGGDVLRFGVEGQDRQLVLAVTVKARGQDAETRRVQHEKLKALGDELVDAARASAARGRAFE